MDVKALFYAILLLITPYHFLSSADVQATNEVSGIEITAETITEALLTHTEQLLSARTHAYHSGQVVPLRSLSIETPEIVAFARHHDLRKKVRSILKELINNSLSAETSNRHAAATVLLSWSHQCEAEGKLSIESIATTICSTSRTPIFIEMCYGGLPLCTIM